MPVAGDRVAHHPEESQDRTDNDEYDTDRPENGDYDNEADDEENDAENNHRGLLAGDDRRPGRRYGDMYVNPGASCRASLVREQKAPACHRQYRAGAAAGV